MVAADQPGLLQRAHAPEAGRRRDADAAGELDIGHAPIGLEFAQDAQVDIVKFGAHENPRVKVALV
jgi:hypothetical protein